MDDLLDGDGRLDAVLRSVGVHLDVPQPTGWDGPRAAPSRRWLPVLVVAVVALLLATTLAVAPVRRAVAGWLGIGSTRVEQVGPGEASTTGLPVLADGAQAITAEDASRLLGGRPVPASLLGLGRPDALVTAREGGVLLVWNEGATTLWLRPLPFDGGMYVKKLVAGTDGIRSVQGIGDAALVIDQPHVLVTPDRRVASGRVVLWLQDDLEHRLESELPLDRMLTIARDAAQPVGAQKGR